MHRYLPIMAMILVPSVALAAPTLQTITSARVVDAARTVLDACLGNDAATAQVSVVGKPDDILVLPGSITVHARRPEGHWPRSRVGMPVDISVNGSVVRSATVWFAVSVHHDVLSYTEDAPLGQVAAAMKFASHEVDIAAMQGDVVADPRELIGMRLRHAVVAGVPVLREDFEHVPDVDRQQRVDVIAIQGVITLQAKGTAIGRGNAGDIISVQVDGAEDPVRARVTDKGAVQVVD